MSDENGQEKYDAILEQVRANPGQTVAFYADEAGLTKSLWSCRAISMRKRGLLTSRKRDARGTVWTVVGVTATPYRSDAGDEIPPAPGGLPTLESVKAFTDSNLRNPLLKSGTGHRRNYFVPRSVDTHPYYQPFREGLGRGRTPPDHGRIQWITAHMYLTGIWEFTFDEEADIINSIRVGDLPKLATEQDQPITEVKPAAKWIVAIEDRGWIFLSAPMTILRAFGTPTITPDSSVVWEMLEASVNDWSQSPRPKGWWELSFDGNGNIIYAIRLPKLGESE